MLSSHCFVCIYFVVCVVSGRPMPYHARAVRGTVVVAKGRKHVLARVTREHVRPFSERSARHSALPFTSQWVQVTRAAREHRPRLRLRARWVGDVWAAPWRGSARIGGFFHPFGEGLQPPHLVQPGAAPGGVVKFERCAGCCLLVPPTSASTAAASGRASAGSNWCDSVSKKP